VRGLKGNVSWTEFEGLIKPMAARVKLRDVIDAMDLPNQDWQSYLNRDTGEIVTVTDEDLASVEDDADLDDLYEHSLPGSPTVRVDVEARTTQSSLMRLCGRVVTRSDPNMLRLEFDDGQILAVPVSGGPYESYSVTVGDREFTI
jgi:hypothetical protein